MIEVSREKLENILKECWEEARPYTGESWMGKADLANELLGNPEIDWDKHPRSVESLIREKLEKQRMKECDIFDNKVNGG